LVEALIALALTALVTTSLYSGLFGVGRTARAAAEQNRADDTRRLTARLLHDLLAGAVPFAETRRDAVTVLFEGRRDGLRFVGHLPAHASNGGLQLVDVHVAGAAATSRLELSFRNAWPEIELDTPLTDGGWLHESLAAGPARLRARYYGRAAQRDPLAWHDDWAVTDRLPDLVELEIEAPEGVTWPPLVVPLRLQRADAAGQWFREAPR
jgi:general secretion pathway protein J